MSSHPSATRFRDEASGILVIVVALQILPLSDIIAKHLSLSLPVAQVIWGRFFFHCAITGIWVAITHGRVCLLPPLSPLLLLRSLALFAAVGLFYVTIHYLPLTTSLTLWFVEPFMLTLMAALILKERVTKRQWLAIFTGFAGVLIAMRPMAAWHWAYGVGLLAGFFYALFLFLTRFIEAKTPASVSVYHTGLAGGVIASVAAAPGWVTPEPMQWIWLLATGAIAAVAHLFIIRAFERAQASTIAPFTYTEILMGAVLGYLVFNDLPDIWLLIGLAVVVGSGVMLLHSDK